jgi:ABC-type transport system involved in multi-copper enzyme maturation permease subunit
MLDSAFLMLGQAEIVINWFTPVWIVALGISLGFLVAMLFVGLVYLISMIPGLNQIGAKSKSFWIAGAVTTVLLLAAAIGIPVWRQGVSLSEFVNQQPVEMIFLAAFAALVGFAIWVLGARSRIDEMRELLSEGLLRYLSIFCLGMLGFTALGLLLNIFSNVGLFQIVEDPKGLLNSLARIPTANWQERTYEVPPSAPASPGEQLPISLNGRETRDMVIKSNQQIDLAFRPMTSLLNSDAIFQVQSTSAETGTRFRMDGRLPDDKVESVYIFNRGTNPANVTIAWLVSPVYREMYAVPLIAAGVAIFFIAFMCLSALSPKVSAIALATFKTEIGQPLFLLVLVIGLGFILLSIYFPYNTFGEDIKMYKDSGMTLIRVLAIFAAIWAASKSVAEEIEGRTALTVLSKPVGRRQFILGKFFGISAAMTWLFVLLGFWFVFWVAYKPLYDAKESTLPDIDWTNCFAAVTSIIPVMLLAFLEVVVFVAISVAISTRFGILANLMICFAIYVLGHLTPQLVQSNQMVEAFAPVVFFGQLIAIIFPVLDHFDAQTAINTDKAVPLLYLGWSFIYTLLYGSLALLLALVLFEDRDLA